MFSIDYRRLRSPFHRKKGAEFVETGRRCLPGITDLHTRDNGASHNGGGRAIVGGKDEGAVFPFSASIRDFHNAMTEDGLRMERRIDRRIDGWIDLIAG